MPRFAEVFVEFLPSDKGGRKTPVWLGEDAPGRYRPHLRVRGGDQTYLGVEFVKGPEGPILPGGSSYSTVRFMYEPRVSYEALTVGAEFDILEGGRTVGSGRVIRQFEGDHVSPDDSPSSS